jgi:hypothetical protein
MIDYNAVKIEKYDDILTRKLIELVKVRKDKTVVIRFKGGAEFTESVE